MNNAELYERADKMKRTWDRVRPNLMSRERAIDIIRAHMLSNPDWYNNHTPDEGYFTSLDKNLYLDHLDKVAMEINQ